MTTTSNHLSTSEFLAQLRGRKIRIVPRIKIPLEDGGTMVMEADCSGCNNANQPVPYHAGQAHPKRWTGPANGAEADDLDECLDANEDKLRRLQSTI